MKLNNDLLILDLETTAGEDENGFQINNSIVQMGAVLLDRQLNKISTFESLVKPREPVSEFITNLTGITDEQAQAAPDFWSVSAKFDEWVIMNVKNVKLVRIVCHGVYFDLPILRRLYREYGLQFPYSGTAFDTKTLAFLWMSLSGRRTDKLSVSHMASIMGITPRGVYHNALVDAQAEADILIRIITDLNSGTFLNGKLLKISST